MRRIVVTGLGMVAPCGTGVRAAWNAALEARSGVKAITHFDASDLTVKIAATVGDFPAIFIVHPGPRSLAAIGVLPEPPVFPDTLPGPRKACGVVVRPSVGVRAGRTIIHSLAKQAPFLLRDRHRIRAAERRVRHAHERRRMP